MSQSSTTPDTSDWLHIPRAGEHGLPDSKKRAPIVGRSNEGKPGTRKTRYRKVRAKRMGGKP